MAQYAAGQRGNLRIGMECHPCYQWLLKVVAPYLAAWPDVDVDVKQKFQFGGIGALLGHEIDMLVTPDPLAPPGLAVRAGVRLRAGAGGRRTAIGWPGKRHVTPEQLSGETLITYPVPIERLDIYNQFLLPAGCQPKRHKTIETTDIMLQMVASGRGVAALPRWLVEEYASKLAISAVRLGPQGIAKQIFLGMRDMDTEIGYLKAFVELAHRTD